MKILSLSWFGFTVLTLVQAVAIPVTDDDAGPTGDAPFDDFYPHHPPTQDYGHDWMEGTDGDSHWDFSCPDGWSMHSTQCLLFVPQNLTWNEAKKNCASKGDGSLAAVSSDIQADEIYNEMERAGHHGGQVWVGGSRTSQVDPSFPAFAKFCNEQSSHHENDCLQISFDHGSGCLDATKCDAELPSVCAILLY
ncbi:type-2 ice-structuring protein-like [Poeciliopsis prolifica]|uniref:type-2 ice-structuring protein-like n=1 Tax=Poeciliopsis prolifica TaxID=188132 RepID=UPI002413F63B|nr:type-2 ice-structuring protein-like [Poeciliopsis prolifica]XP_054876242.1 type-2 ice-structuring protein-like [Poeciliopsis prolifica]XP_054876249.1 type-2 ice-structuring protein-like [Poeciliopsis prolifica]